MFAFDWDHMKRWERRELGQALRRSNELMLANSDSALIRLFIDWAATYFELNAA
jgi:hypothetical protein